MANAFVKYLQDTRGELRHVAWPTRTQTIVYAILVAAISVGIALYLALFDLVFTTGLGKTLNALPAAGTNPSSAIQVTPQPPKSSSTSLPISLPPLR